MPRSWGQIQLECDRAIELAPGRWPSYITSAYQDILNRRKWLGLTESFRLTTIQAVSAGTISITKGATAVTGSGTAWDPSLTRMQLLVSEGPETYGIEITSATTAELDRPYERDSVVDTGYRIFRQNYALPLDVKSVSSIRRPGYPRALERIHRAAMQDHGIQFGEPTKWAYGLQVGTDPEYKTVDLIAIPDLEIALNVEYQVAPVHFNGRNTSDYPLDWVSDDAIIYGAKALAAMDKGLDYEGYGRWFEKSVLAMEEQENQRIGAISTEFSQEFNGANDARSEYYSW